MFTPEEIEDIQQFSKIISEHGTSCFCLECKALLNKVEPPLMREYNNRIQKAKE